MSTHDDPSDAQPTAPPSSWPQPQPPARPPGWSAPSIPSYAPGSSIPRPGTAPGYSSPAAVGGAYPPGSVNPMLLGSLGSSDGRPSLRYPRRAQSPLLPMVAYVAAVIVGTAAVIAAAAAWIEEGDVEQRTSGTYDSYGTYRTTSIPGQVYLVWFLAAFVIGCLFIWWMSRIGANWGQFGPGLPAAIAFPVWLWVASFIPVVSLVVLVVQIVWPVRLLAQGIVRGGGLPRWLALFGWIPLLTLVLAPLSLLFWLAIPLTTTIIQHLGIRQDRRALLEFDAARGR